MDSHTLLDTSVRRTQFQGMAARTNARGLTLRRRCADFDRLNREAAEIILRDVARYGGFQAGLVQWAIAAWTRLKGRRHERRAAA